MVKAQVRGSPPGQSLRRYLSDCRRNGDAARRRRPAAGDELTSMPLVLPQIWTASGPGKEDQRSAAGTTSRMRTRGSSAARHPKGTDCATASC